MPTRMLRLRRADRCASCGAGVAAGAQAHWDSVARTVTCHDCHQVTIASPPLTNAPAPPASTSAPHRGGAGESALREYERRKRAREERTRSQHPVLGVLLLAVRDAPQHETAFLQGSRGEAAVAAALEKRTADGPAVLLYDRRMPGGLGNIDLLAIAPSGVYVIDAKDHKGKVSIATPLMARSKL